MRASRIASLQACDSGAVAIIVAILAPVLVGAMGLGADSGYWNLTQRQLQNAADSAAHGAGRVSLSDANADLMQQIA